MELIQITFIKEDAASSIQERSQNIYAHIVLVMLKQISLFATAQLEEIATVDTF